MYDRIIIQQLTDDICFTTSYVEHYYVGLMEQVNTTRTFIIFKK